MIFDNYKLGLEWGDHLGAYPNTINILPFYLIILGFSILILYVLFHKHKEGGEKIDGRTSRRKSK